MALQGTLDTFALPDVLRLLASTTKTGRLDLTGSRGTGSVWVANGRVVEAAATGARHAAGPVDVVFELLRFDEGSFTFETDSAAPNPSTPSDVDPLLREAETMVAEWRVIETVIPSLDAWVALQPEVPEGDIVIDPERWRAIAAVGGGATVWSVGETLRLGDVAVCRRLKELVELELVSVSAAPEPTVSAQGDDPFDFSIELPGHSARAELDRLTASVESGEPADYAPSLADSLLIDSDASEANSVPAPVTLDEEPAHPVPPPVFADAAPDEADEVARQLASLSPQAARAVAAAAKAETDEEREAALAEMNDEDEPINRGLLLKFLSSVRS